MDFGFEDQFEIRIQFSDEEGVSQSAFSAILKRESLREPENMLVHKYGRKTEREFTLFGVIAQAQPRSMNESSQSVMSEDMDFSGNLRTRLLKMVDNFVEMDNAMSGRSSDEVYIDPIALYLDVRTGTERSET